MRNIGFAWDLSCFLLGLYFPVLQKFQREAFFHVTYIEGERGRKKLKEDLLFCHMLIKACHCPALPCHLFDVAS